MKNLVFLGPPGAGKGTQASRVSERLGIPHISTGDMLRAAIREQTETGLKAKAYIDKGELVPDEIVIALVKERIAQDDCKNGYILDGFPRTIAQAEALDQITTITKAINITASDQVIVKALSGRRFCPKCGNTTHVDLIQSNQCEKCGAELICRADDQPETVQNRLDVYAKNTKPLLDYYAKKGLLCDVTGHRGIDVVFKDVMAALGE